LSPAVVLPCALKSTLLTTGHTVSFHSVDNSHTPWHSLGNARKTDNIVVVLYTRNLAYFFPGGWSIQKNHFICWFCWLP